MFKKCFVPSCSNNNRNKPKKMFIYLPKEENIRKLWFEVVKLQISKVPKTGNIFCCEDHFNLEDDMENYMEYKLSRVRARMKPDVVPHKFACQSDRNLLVQMNKINARRKEISDYARQSEKRVQEDPPGPSTSTIVRQVCDIACQTTPIHFESKFVQTTLKSKDTDTSMLAMKFPRVSTRKRQLDLNWASLQLRIKS